MTPSNFVVFLKGVFLQMSSGSEIILAFCLPKFSGMSHLGDLFYHAWLLFIYPNLDC